MLDLQIPGPGGVEATADVLRHDPSARVLILSASGEQRDVLEAVRAAATGYLVKSASVRSCSTPYAARPPYPVEHELVLEG
ncbi:MAG: response regulator [Nocardioides sp.]